LNDAAKGGVLSTSVAAGLPAGSYRLCSINSAANHQPVLAPIAQHGSLDDCVYVCSNFIIHNIFSLSSFYYDKFTASANGQPSNGNGGGQGVSPYSYFFWVFVNWIFSLAEVGTGTVSLNTTASNRALGFFLL
jgi:hypothetical protein